MTRKILFNVLAMIFLVASMIGNLDSATRTAAATDISDAAGKIEPALIDKLNQEGTVDYIIQFVEQADLSAAYEMSWEERGDFVYRTLKETAAHSQARVKGILDAAGFQHQTFIAGNELYVTLGNIELATHLAAMSEVAYIRATRTYSIEPLVENSPILDVHWAGDLLTQNLNANLGSSDALISWGIVDTNADQFWTAFNSKGGGITVANIDTGVQYDHPALDQSFACKANPSDPACWLDAINECVGDLPCDTHWHGTHVMGTMVADDDTTLSYIAGMAPEADWIACKACNKLGTCTDLGLSKCADWMLAPGDNPSNRPNVVNNSWSYQGGNIWFLPKVEAWRASGIFPSFVAGNFGASCATIGSPGDYQESFATAAHDPMRTIAWFSGRGPSDFGHDPYTKPNISAPGVNILSAIPNSLWGMASGTSQAAPHTAGAVALLWSCNPALVGEIDMTYQILHYTANTTPAGSCGVPEDNQGNYTYGYGYLDVLAAGTDYCGLVDYGTIEGYIFDNRGDPVDGVTVSAFPSIQSAGIQSVTDPTGFYSMDLLVGTYDLTAYHPDYIMETISDIEVIKNTVTRAPAFVLDYLGKWVELEKFPGCPDWTRYDGEYFPGDGKIYFLGGRSSTSTLPDIYAFDIDLGQCTDTGTDMAIGISNYTIVPLEVGGKDLLCTFGGRVSDSVNTNVVQCYDPVANIVTQPTTLPSSIATYIPGGAVNVENKAYLFGGLAYTEPWETAETWKWDPVINLWTKLGNMIQGVSYPQSAVVDGLIYSFGGSIYDPRISDFPLVAQKVAQVLDPALGSWVKLADMPMASAEGRAFGFEPGTDFEVVNQVIVTGGGQFPASTAEVFSYDIDTNTYDTSFADLNVSRRDHASVLVPGGLGEALTMWVFGGRFSTVNDEPPYAPPETFDVKLTVPRIMYSPTEFDKNVLVDTPRTTPMDIINIGGGTLEWSITPDAPWLSFDPDSGFNNTAVDVIFNPTGMDLGVYTSTFAINSTDPFSSVVTVPVTMTIVIQEAGVTLSPEVDSESGDPGEAVKYSLYLENTGNYIDTYTLSASGDWDVLFPTTSIELEDGEFKVIDIQVLVPSSAAGGAVEAITITATSGFNKNVSDSSVLTTTANTVYALNLVPDTASALGHPGDIIQYQLTLTNLGNTQDSVTLTATGNLWDVDLSMAAIELAPGETEEVLVTVSIPLHVSNGEDDIVTINATSESTLKEATILTTQVYYYQMILPLIPK